MVHRIRIVLLIIVFLNGCAAVSGISQQQLITTKKSKNQSSLFNTGVTFRCDDIILSMMVFPLIPLPPIIPTFWLLDDKVRIHINPKNEEQYLIAITIKNQNGKVLFSYKVPAENDISLNLEFPGSCTDLDGSIVTLTEQNKLNDSIKSHSYILQYSKTGLEFNWVYLSA